MTPDEVSKHTLDAIGALLNKLPGVAARRDAMELLMITCYNFMRQFGGDEYTRGWLESALKDVIEEPAAVKYTSPH